MKSFYALKVLTQSAEHLNGNPNGTLAVWRWAAVPVCCMRACGSVLPRLDRHPTNFMLYLKTLHILCLLCQTSFLHLIRQNGKNLTAAQISVISLWNRFRNGNRGGSSCAHLQIRHMLDLHHNNICRKKGNSTSSSMVVNMRSIQDGEIEQYLVCSFTRKMGIIYEYDITSCDDWLMWTVGVNSKSLSRQRVHQKTNRELLLYAAHIQDDI